jgi:hypothetical protein
VHVLGREIYWKEFSRTTLSRTTISRTTSSSELRGSSNDYEVVRMNYGVVLINYDFTSVVLVNSGVRPDLW